MPTDADFRRFMTVAPDSTAATSRHPGLAALPGSQATITEAFYPGAVAPECVDGRNARARLSRSLILMACRSHMRSGVFRPSMESICGSVSRSVRTGFTHFDDVDALYLEAIQDHTTRQAIAARLVGDELVALSPETVQRMVRGAVLGRSE